MIEDEAQRANTEKKLDELQERIRSSEVALAEDATNKLKALSLSSLKRIANELTEELARYRARSQQPVSVQDCP